MTQQPHQQQQEQLSQEQQYRQHQYHQYQYQQHQQHNLQILKAAIARVCGPLLAQQLNSASISGISKEVIKVNDEKEEEKDAINFCAMKSFLEDIIDNGITWVDALEEEAQSSDDSDDSSSSSEEDEDDNDEDEDDNSLGEDNDGGANDDNNDSDGDDAQEEEEEEEEEADGNDPLVNTMSKLRSHPRREQLLFRVARSEELPLVRAEIDWDLLTSELSSYPASHVDDDFGSILLQGILRMDPPLSVVRETLRSFQKSCVDMKSFDVACQYASDDVVRLVMHRTMQSRRLEGIKWDMLAFLGDARIQTRHAKMLLQSIPEAVTDPEHGLFGVSPLDRMMSGAFIHGDPNVWVEKLKLALITAEYGLVDSDAASRVPFFPFHALIRRLVAQDFMGVKFGPYSFVQTLGACLRSEEGKDQGPFHSFDYAGHLPLHVALSKWCNTNLGVLGERKLIKFLLQIYPQSAVIMMTTISSSSSSSCTHSCVTSGGIGARQIKKHPLRMSIENGWPCYDIIADAVPHALSSGNEDGDLLLHIALSGPYHARFGISGARKIVKYFLRKYPKSAFTPNGAGKMPLHLALEYKWPVHDILMSACPQAVETRDTVSCFYPFQIAACSFYQPMYHNKNTSRQQEQREHDEQKQQQNTQQQEGGGSQENKKQLRELSILYELIREAPPLLAHGVDGTLSSVPSPTKSIKTQTNQPHSSSAAPVVVSTTSQGLLSQADTSATTPAVPASTGREVDEPSSCSSVEGGATSKRSTTGTHCDERNSPPTKKQRK